MYFFAGIGSLYLWAAHCLKYLLGNGNRFIVSRIGKRRYRSIIRVGIVLSNYRFFLIIAQHLEMMAGNLVGKGGISSQFGGC